ncbi:MAG: hypothetical protein IIW50_00040 [Alistipes sp.]|nr:hypothetical protein [Alistipes sp.]
MEKMISEEISKVFAANNNLTQNSNDVVQSSSQEHSNVIDLMRGFMDNENPKVGIFWYNFVDNTLFGVEKGDAELYNDQGSIIAYPKLHKTYWQKQHHRAVAKNDINSIFYKEHNYTLIPRGRIFLEGGIFYVNVGSWINGEVNGQNCIDKDKLRDLIVDEFNLPNDFIFRVDHHWDIGHDWSEEKF